MHIETGTDMAARMSVVRGRMVGYQRGDNYAAYRRAHRELTMLKALRLQEVVVDLLRQVTEGQDVSVEETLGKAKRALDAIVQVINEVDGDAR